MRYAALLAATLLATPALAQGTSTPSTPSTPPSPSDSSTSAARDASGRPGHGAAIKMKAPNGASISVRCADGETTRACSEIVTQLLEKARSMGGERRRDDDDRGGRFRDRDY